MIQEFPASRGDVVSPRVGYHLNTYSLSLGNGCFVKQVGIEGPYLVVIDVWDLLREHLLLVLEVKEREWSEGRRGDADEKFKVALELLMKPLGFHDEASFTQTMIACDKYQCQLAEYE